MWLLYQKRMAVARMRRLHRFEQSMPKDSFPMPKIDQLVDASATAQRLSFLDAYSGYHQIPMHQPDQEATSFRGLSSNYCYKVMPFGLKIAGATYQRAITWICAPHLGKTMGVYIDDIVVMSRQNGDHISNLKAVFDTLRKYDLKLNASKCAFGVGAGKFLGFIVRHWGIEANPSQI